MQGNLSDLLLILRDVELNFSRLYANVANIEGQYNARLKTAALVLSRQEKDHAKAYGDLADQIKKTGTILMEGSYFDSAKQMLLSFKREIQSREFGNVEALIDFAVAYERLNAEALTALLKEMGETSSPEVAELLNFLIGVEKEHTHMLLQFKKT